MQISSVVGDSTVFMEDVRTQFAQRYADARAKPMPAPGVRSMKLEACSACTRGPEPEVRSLQPEERNKKPEPEAQSLQPDARSPKPEARSICLSKAHSNPNTVPMESNTLPIESEHRAN